MIARGISVTDSNARSPLFSMDFRSAMRFHINLTHFKIAWVVITIFETIFGIVGGSFQDTVKTSEQYIYGAVTVLFAIITLLLLWRYSVLIGRSQMKNAFRWEVALVSLITIGYIFSDLNNYKYIKAKNFEGYDFILSSGWAPVWRYVLLTTFPFNIYTKALYMIPTSCTHFYIAWDANQNVFYCLRIFYYGLSVLWLCYLFSQLREREIFDFYHSKIEERISKVVLSSIPESIIILDKENKLRYQTEYFEKKFNHIFERGRVIDSQFLNCFEDLKLRAVKENDLGVITIHSHGSINEKLECDESKVKDFETKLHHVKTFKDLLEVFNDQNTTRNRAVVYDTKYIDPVTTQTLSIEIKAAPLTLRTDKYTTIVIRDTTERDQIVYLQNEKVQYRNNLIASFSHELRTPLNSNLILLEECLASKELSGDMRSTLKTAHSSSKLLLFLIDDILDYSSFLFRKIEPKIIKKNLNGTIKEVLELFETKMEGKGISLITEISSEVDRVFNTDHRRLSQILANLMSNAVKYVQKGYVKVSLEAQKTNSFKISVEDSGIGISEETKQKLNNLFQGNISQKASSDSSGIGFGLMISNEIAKILNFGGNSGLEVESILGKTIVSFKLNERLFDSPGDNSMILLNTKTTEDIGEEFITKKKIYSTKSMKKLRQKKATSSHLISSTEQGRKQKILIVDDEFFNIKALEIGLKSFDFELMKAFNGQEALDLCLRYPDISLVFMDVNMPIMSGLESTKNLRDLSKKNKINSEIVIIGVTAYVTPEDILSCTRSGMDMVLHKPLSKNELNEALRIYQMI